MSSVASFPKFDDLQYDILTLQLNRNFIKVFNKKEAEKQLREQEHLNYITARWVFNIHNPKKPVMEYFVYDTLFTFHKLL